MTMTETTTLPATDTAVVSIPAAHFARILGNAALFTDDTKTGTVIDNVLVTVADGILSMESTNRYVLYRETLTLPDDGQSTSTTFLVDRTDVPAIVKACKASAKAYGACEIGVTVIATDGKARFVGPQDTWSVAGQARSTVGMSWPKTQELRSQFKSGAVPAIAINPNILAKFAKVVASEGHDTKGYASPPLRFEFHNDTKAFEVHVGKSIDCMAMPVRV